MHCPFCVKADHYHDPVILKAHYRVKHVDKGIEFGGLYFILLILLFNNLFFARLLILIKK